MAGIMNREFEELAQNGLNYLTWASDVELVLEGRKLKGALDAGTQTAPSKTTPAENAQALHFLRHHMCTTLKHEYMAERSASALWNALEARFARLKYTIKPRAEADWMRLRFADFKTVGEYNSALHLICTQLDLCGTKTTESQKIEKTLSTFHPSALQSARNYRQENFTQYALLIDALQVAEAQDEVLKKNFNSQPFGGGPRQEVYAGAYKVRQPKFKKRGKKGKKGPKYLTLPAWPSNIRRVRGGKAPGLLPLRLQDPFLKAVLCPKARRGRVQGQEGARDAPCPGGGTTGTRIGANDDPHAHRRAHGGAERGACGGTCGGSHERQRVHGGCAHRAPSTATAGHRLCRGDAR